MSVRARLLFVALLGLLSVVAAAVGLTILVPVGATYVWKAGVVFAIAMTIAVGAVERHHLFPRLGPANVVTMVRVCLLALVAALIGEPPAGGVAWTGVIGASAIAMLDGVDGWLARRSKMSSNFGARFDMETDALLILVLSVLVWRHGKAGAWIILAGLLRYAFVASGWWLPWMRRPLRPTVRGKTVAAINMVGLTVALGPVIPGIVSEGVAAATLAALIWSFEIDVRRLWRNEGAAYTSES